MNSYISQAQHTYPVYREYDDRYDYHEEYDDDDEYDDRDLADNPKDELLNYVKEFESKQPSAIERDTFYELLRRYRKYESEYSIPYDPEFERTISGWGLICRLA